MKYTLNNATDLGAINYFKRIYNSPATWNATTTIKCKTIEANGVNDINDDKGTCLDNAPLNDSVLPKKNANIEIKPKSMYKYCLSVKFESIEYNILH